MSAEEAFKGFVEVSNEDDITAYKAIYEAYKGGQSKHQIAQYYSKWAENGQYDMHLDRKRYTGPERAALALATYFQMDDRDSARILDIAAGTGRLGAELHNLGFRTIDALDPSEGMLQKARERGIYTNFINDFIGEENSVPVEDNTYDGVGCSGGFGEGHIPSSALMEIIRIVRPGGVICIAMREEYLDYVSEYKGILLPLIQKLETEGKWKLQAKDVIPNYVFGKPGIIFHFIVS